MQNEQIRITRDNAISLSSHGDFKIFVVFRITTSLNLLLWFNSFNCFAKNFEKKVCFLTRKISGEFFSVKNAPHFGEASFGSDQIAVV